MKQLATYWLFLVLLFGCAIETPKTFNDRVGYALGIHTSVLNTTTRALEFGEITADEAENVAGIADNARGLIDAARTAWAAGDQAGADQNITVALSLLRQLQDYLRRTT